MLTPEVLRSERIQEVIDHFDCMALDDSEVLLCWRGEISEAFFQRIDDDGEPLTVTRGMEYMPAATPEATLEATPEATPAAPIPAATPAMVSNAASSHQFAPLAVPSFAKPPCPQGPPHKARPRSSERLKPPPSNVEPPPPVVRDTHSATQAAPFGP